MKTLAKMNNPHTNPVPTMKTSLDSEAALELIKYALDTASYSNSYYLHATDPTLTPAVTLKTRQPESQTQPT
jgi:hypothetical protein